METTPYPSHGKLNSIPQAVIKLAVSRTLYFFRILVSDDFERYPTKQAINACVTHPVNAKWEWACNKYFWLIMGRGNAILYRSIQTRKETATKQVKLNFIHC